MGMDVERDGGCEINMMWFFCFNVLFSVSFIYVKVTWLFLRSFFLLNLILYPEDSGGRNMQLGTMMMKISILLLSPNEAR